MAGFELSLAELDNQDAFSSQTDGREQSNLKINIVGKRKKNAASTAPMTPSGTTNMTEAGIVQLS